MSKARRGLRLLQRSKSEPWRISEAYTVFGRLLALRHSLDHSSSGDALEKAARDNKTYAPAHYHYARHARSKGQQRTYIRRLTDASTANPFFCPAITRLRREKPRGVNIPETCR